MRSELVGLLVLGLVWGCDDGGSSSSGTGGQGGVDIGGQGGGGAGGQGQGGMGVAGQGGMGVGGQGGMGVGGQGGMGVGGQGGMGVGGQGGMGVGGQGGAGGIGNESTNALCDNGIDDDGDGLIDCDDRHCLANPAVTVCPGARENSDERCDDGQDNDGNGHIDCRDFACSQNPWVSVCGPHEATDEACSDGVDNDGNNFVDCDDFACSRNPLVGVCGTSEAGFCIDGRDNDDDGLVDCDDPDCDGVDCGGMGGMGGGGAGGGCVPDCSQSECGPDGCGGTCGPGCGAGELCSNGRCQAGECGQDTFECGGECVDLVSDVHHCGSCGTQCADDWPVQMTQAGISLQASGMVPGCQQAECLFTCPGAGVLDPGELLDSLDHCGGCNQRCRHNLQVSQGSLCSAGECECLVDENTIGAVCGNRCVHVGDNCNGGCCPELNRPAQGQIRAQGVHIYRFSVDVLSASIIEVDTANCDDVRLSLAIDNDEGVEMRSDSVHGDCQYRLDASPGVQYAIHIRANQAVQYTVSHRHTAYPVFPVPGQLQAQAVDDAFVAVLNVQRSDVFNFQISGGANCAGDLRVLIEDLQREEVFFATFDACLVLEFNAAQPIELDAGQYYLTVDGDLLQGQYTVRAQ